MRFDAQVELRRIRDAAASASLFPSGPIPPRGMSVPEWIAAGKPSGNHLPAAPVSEVRLPRRWSQRDRCMEYSDNPKKPHYLRRKGGKVCYTYLAVVRAARRERGYFYMCPTGDHWHLTSSDRWGAVPGKISTRQRRATEESDMTDDRDLTDAEKQYLDNPELQATVENARAHPEDRVKRPRPRTGMVRGPGDRSGTKK